MLLAVRLKPVSHRPANQQVNVFFARLNRNNIHYIFEMEMRSKRLKPVSYFNQDKLNSIEFSVFKYIKGKKNLILFACSSQYREWYWYRRILYSFNEQKKKTSKFRINLSMVYNCVYEFHLKLSFWQFLFNSIEKKNPGSFLFFFVFIWPLTCACEWITTLFDKITFNLRNEIHWDGLFDRFMMIFDMMNIFYTKLCFTLNKPKMK